MKELKRLVQIQPRMQKTIDEQMAGISEVLVWTCAFYLPLTYFNTSLGSRGGIRGVPSPNTYDMCK